jgi:hypothetical protein
MRITIFLLALLWASAIAIAQAPDSTAWRYAEIVVPLGGFSSKSKVEVNYGENVTGWFRKPELITDESTGKAIKFKSAIDALNYMSMRGWELVQSYHSQESTGLTSLEYQHFIMRRREVVVIEK